MIINTPIEFLKGVGMQKAKLLASNLGIYTFKDLLHFYPKKYIDRSTFYKIAELYNSKTQVQLIGKISSIEEVNQGKIKYLKANFEDESGNLTLMWFKKIEFIKNHLKKNEPLVVFGKVNFFQNRPQIVHPEIKPLEEYKSKPQILLYPIYLLNEKLQKSGITNRFIVRLLKELFEKLENQLNEIFSSEIIEKNKLTGRKEALKNIHFPRSLESLSKAEYRLKFEELFFLQWILLLKKRNQGLSSLSYPFEKVGELFNLFYFKFLPFPLTTAQIRVLKEIREDLGKPIQMNRLLQGDVGSGKTIVAFMSMLLAIDNGFQACLMAPTEVLAAQHYLGIKVFCEPLGISLSLLSGSTKASKKKEIYEKIKKKEISIVIGTHALIQKNVEFSNLGLAVIDEQHRFGVAQRASFWRKNQKPPHILLMSATPIARTLAMSLYGDLDVSIIDELPRGRKPIKTLHYYENRRLEVFRFLKNQLAQGRQAYIVYPLVEESKNMDYKYLMDGYESITREFTPPNYHIGILHGRMKAEEKELEMKKFVEGISQIMVATTVIEVGVNVPNASLIIIENTERFGLLQLHQLRGRVGRGSHESYCILMSSFKLTSDAKKRIEVLVKTNNGFEIAEEDLKLRGPGDLMGTQQSGILEMKIASLAHDSLIMAKARQSATELISKDPNLILPENKALQIAMLEHKNKLAWSKIG